LYYRYPLNIYLFFKKRFFSINNRK